MQLVNSNIDQEQIRRVYYSTTEVAALLNLPVRIVRDWIRRFNVACLRNNRGCARLTEKEIDQLRHIHNLLFVERYSIEGVRLKLKNLR